MSTERCPNIQPVTTKDLAGHPLRFDTCGECGGYFAILTSGVFRKHKRRYPVGDPRIAQAIARAMEKGQP